MAKTATAAKKSAAETMYPSATGATVATSVQRQRQDYDQRLISLRDIRQSWWTHWAELAKYILPRRYRWLTSTAASTTMALNDNNRRGMPLNTAIIDNSGTIAARTLSSGMMAGTASPARPWFRLTSPDDDIAYDPDAVKWLAEVQRRMLRVMAASNYYSAKAQQYEDLAVFGTAPMIIYEDDDSMIRCYNPCAGEYFCAVNSRNLVDTLFREFTMTARAIVKEFGVENVSTAVRTAYESPSLKDQSFAIGHAIEPNPEYARSSRGYANENGIGENGVARHFSFMEHYWEIGRPERGFLRVRGFHDQPFAVPRWSVNGDDAYGRSPGMDALGDIKQLQLEQKRKAQAIDKMVNPPMVADVAMKNQPTSLLPGGITYASGMTPNAGFVPALKLDPRIGEMVTDIQDVRQRIRDAFYNNLFLMISQLDTVRTATEIDARREEQLLQLGPVLERNDNEGLNPDIKRIFAIMMRRGAFPPPPQAIIRSGAIKVEYVSMLAEAQRAAGTTAIERTWAFAGNVSAAKPEILDNLDGDESIHEYGSMLRVPPKIFNSPAKVRQIRAMRQQQQASAAAMQAATVAVDAGKTLSETEVGGGQSALNLMLGGGGPIGAPG